MANQISKKKPKAKPVADCKINKFVIAHITAHNFNALSNFITGKA